MAPVATQTLNESVTAPIETLKLKLQATSIEAADLRRFSHFDASPAIGTEFRAYSPDGKPTLSIREVLKDDAKLKALGRLVSERGVVFFRDAEITEAEQKVLVQALGVHGGKPASSGLHVHPLTLVDGGKDEEISVISNKFVFHNKFAREDRTILDRGDQKLLWHSDITFENVPSDYASLQIRQLPEGGGGDTLWASAYEAYDRLSPAYQRFLEGLTATHQGTGFLEIAKRNEQIIRDKRGSPENNTQDLLAVHPVIRTNPVTGWKGLFVNRGFTKKVNELTKPESDALLEYLFNHISGNHDLQVRFRWEANSLAIWDNRSTFHAATHDVDDNLREGSRSVSLGERPYLDPHSKSRRQALAEASA